MDARLKGCICGVASAICYGTNPFGALGLKAEGITAGSTLFYRFTIAMVILGVYLLFRRESFAVTLRVFLVLASLGVLMGFSSLGLFLSFNYMEAGVASTILFVYPVMVAVIMAVAFRERVTVSTVVAILLSLAGIVLLYQGNGEATLSLVGVLLVLFSSLTYAIYIIVSQKMPIQVPPIKAAFFVLVFGALTVFAYTTMVSGQSVQWLETPAQWGYALSLAVVSTIISLVLLTIAVKEIGSTPTAIMGALEPLTAVMIGVFFFHEHFTGQLAAGIVLILGAVMLNIMGNTRSPKPGAQS